MKRNTGTNIIKKTEIKDLTLGLIAFLFTVWATLY